MIEANEFGAVAMSSAGVVYAGGPRTIAVSADQMNWYQWPCPLNEIDGLHVDGGLLAIVGDDLFAVSEIRHQGKLWQAVDVKGATCVHIASGRRAFVGTSEGRLFEFEIKRPRGLLERLGLGRAMTSPAIFPIGEWEAEPCGLEES